MKTVEQQIIDFLIGTETQLRRRSQCTTAIARMLGLSNTNALKVLKGMERAKVLKRQHPPAPGAMAYWERVEGSAP